MAVEPSSLPTCCRYPNGTSFSSILDEKQSKAILVSNKTSSVSPLYLSVASFNLLADCYVRPYDHRTQSVQAFAAFEWVKDDRWLDAKEFRHPKLLEMIRSSQADVICLQELQLETQPINSKAVDDDGGMSGVVFITPQWIQSFLQSSSYVIRLPPQKELQMIAERNQRVLGKLVAVTCAILIRNDSSSLWRIITPADDSMDHCCETVALAAATESEQEDDTTTCVSACLRYAHTTITPALATSVMVFAVHLDATDEYKRVRQIEKCLQIRRQCLQQQLRDTTATTGSNMTRINPDQQRMGILPVIIAGDMNTEINPGSCVNCFLFNQDDDATMDTRLNVGDDMENDQKDATRYDTIATSIEAECALALRLLTDSSPTPAQLQEWNSMRRKARQIVYDQCVRLSRVELGPTRSAYHFENTGQMTSWKLDHILYDMDTLHPVAMWETLEADPFSQTMGLPNAHCPSDHLPIGALFQVHSLEHPNQQLLSWSHVQELLSRIDMLSTQQQNEKQIVEARFQADLTNLEQSLSIMPSSNDDHNNDRATTDKVNKKKQKKRPKGPPPIPVMECMREKRMTLRELGAKHRAERREFVNRLAFVERRSLFQKTTARTWVELGGSL